MFFIFSQKLNYYTMMKKSIIYPFLVLMTIGSVSGGELKMSTVQSSTINKNLNEWVLVKEESGIKVYFMEVENKTNTYLRIRFDKSSTEDVVISWSLVKNEIVLIDNQIKMINNSHEFNGEIPLIEIKKNESLDDFLIKFNN